MSDIVERLRSSEPLPACPFDRISPHYLTMPADKPCPFCGQENTMEGPDKCRGADTRIMGEAANEIERLTELAKLQGQEISITRERDEALEKVRIIAEDVVWFDWSNNDPDAVHAIEQLRLALKSCDVGGPGQ